MHPARVACGVLALLATLGLAGTCAAQFALGIEAPSAVSVSHPPAGLAAADPGLAPAPPVRLAASSDNWLGAFLEGLFGLPPQSGPRRVRPTVPHRRSPREMHFIPAPEPVAPPIPVPLPEMEEEGVATYRTVCVRLCDGYYWPISFATTTDNFERDETVCRRSCGSPAALYYYLNPGGVPEEMISLQGELYADLSTAFLHRSTYDASCKCRPHPWEAEALERHQSYARPDEPRAATGPRRPRSATSP
jgi:hypothetical protein